MACVVETEIAIDASAEQVWEVLTDFAAYSRWNPFFVRAEGRAEPGARLRIVQTLPDGRVRTSRPIVLMAVPPYHLRWLGRLGIPGLLDTEHAFIVEVAEAGRVRCVQRERFEGFLVLFLRRRLEREVGAGIEAMNRALKRRAEVVAGGRGG